MDTMIIAAIFTITTVVLAYRANIHFRDETRLPMQWGFTGAVNWSAPRYLALAFMPILTVIVLGFQTFMSINSSPQVGQEHLVLPVLIGSGITLILIQLGHFWLIDKTLRQDIA